MTFSVRFRSLRSGDSWPPIGSKEFEDYSIDITVVASPTVLKRDRARPRLWLLRSGDPYCLWNNENRVSVSLDEGQELCGGHGRLSFL